MKPRYGGHERISAKTRLASELQILGRIIVRARESAGLRQAEVAARIGFPASYLSKVENGTRRVDPIELVRIAEAIEVDPAELMRQLQKEMGGSKAEIA